MGCGISGSFKGQSVSVTATASFVIYIICHRSAIHELCPKRYKSQHQVRRFAPIASWSGLHFINPPSRRHFATAKLLLNQQKGCISLIAIQARLCQCLWLLGESRIDQCWDLLGVAARYALAIGLHRASCAHQAPVYDPITVQSSRRTFWCLYSLDIFLSIALGRPRTFNDLDIDQELPSPGEESDDFEDQSLLPLACARPAALATVAYFRYSHRIFQTMI